jgi:hypothetical protein
VLDLLIFQMGIPKSLNSITFLLGIPSTQGAVCPAVRDSDFGLKTAHGCRSHREDARSIN